MRKQNLALLLVLSFALAGCTVRTYPLTRDRVDQDLTGNRGYVLGNLPTQAEVERATTRETRVIAVEFGRPVRVEQKKTTYSEPVSEGNRGYISQSSMPETYETEPVSKACGTFENYTVQKNDTLQKISKKFYGTTKRWNKIYQANQDVLKGPNKLYPGQVLKIPAGGIVKESAMEPTENLK